MGPCTFLVTAVVTGGKDVSVTAKAAEVWAAKGIKVRHAPLPSLLPSCIVGYLLTLARDILDDRAFTLEAPRSLFVKPPTGRHDRCTQEMIKQRLSVARFLNCMLLLAGRSQGFTELVRERFGVWFHGDPKAKLSVAEEAWSGIIGGKFNLSRSNKKHLFSHSSPWACQQESDCIYACSV